MLCFWFCLFARVFVGTICMYCITCLFILCVTLFISFFLPLLFVVIWFNFIAFEVLLSENLKLYIRLTSVRSRQITDTGRPDVLFIFIAYHTTYFFFTIQINQTEQTTKHLNKIGFIRKILLIDSVFNIYIQTTM